MESPFSIFRSFLSSVSSLKLLRRYSPPPFFFFRGRRANRQKIMQINPSPFSVFIRFSPPYSSYKKVFWCPFFPSFRKLGNRCVAHRVGPFRILPFPPFLLCWEIKSQNSSFFLFFSSLPAAMAKDWVPFCANRSFSFSSSFFLLSCCGDRSGLPLFPFSSFSPLAIHHKTERHHKGTRIAFPSRARASFSFPPPRTIQK